MTALAPQACPRCDHAIPASWVEGSCPFCLIRISIEGFADDPIFPPVDGAARFLSTADGQFAGRAIRHESQLLGASFSSDGERVLTFSLDRTARLWTVPEGDSATPPLRHRDRLNFAAFSADGRRVVTCSSDHTARVWDSFTGRPLTQPLRHAEQPTGAVFMPNGTTLLTSGADSIVRPWELRRPPSMEESEEPPFPPVMGDYASADGSFKLTVPEGASEAILTDAQTGRPIGSPLRHTDQITAADFSPDGALVATASKANVAQVWDTVTGRPVSPPLRHQRMVSTVVFSRSGRHLATGSWDGTAQVWDPRTGIRTGRPLVHDAYVNAVCFSPDDRRIATASSDQTARLWDSATGQPLSEPLRHSKAVVRVRFDATGEQLISQDDDGTLCAHAVPRFRTPPPPWLLEVAETIAFDPSIPDRASVLAQLARYRSARAAAISGAEPAVGRRAVVFERLARRLFP